MQNEERYSSLPLESSSVFTKAPPNEVVETDRAEFMSAAAGAKWRQRAHKVVALDAATGQRKWEYGPPVRRRCRRYELQWSAFDGRGISVRGFRGGASSRWTRTAGAKSGVFHSAGSPNPRRFHSRSTDDRSSPWRRDARYSCLGCRLVGHRTIQSAREHFRATGCVSWLVGAISFDGLVWEGGSAEAIYRSPLAGL